MEDDNSGCKLYDNNHKSENLYIHQKFKMYVLSEQSIVQQIQD